MCGVSRLFRRFELFLLHQFYKYGRFLGSHPVWFIVVPLVVACGLSVGILQLKTETDMEYLYAPRESRSIDDRIRVIDTFPDLSSHNFNPYCPPREPPKTIIIFATDHPTTIFNDSVVAEIKEFDMDIKALTIRDGGKKYDYEDLCAKANGTCVTLGSFALGDQFRFALAHGMVTFPYWNPQGDAIDMRRYFSREETRDPNIFVSARDLRLSHQMRGDTEEVRRLSFAWEKRFLEYMETREFTHVKVVYSASQSINLELEKTTDGDVIFFMMTFIMMIAYASIASTGGDCVSTRALLAGGGVLCVLLGVFGSIGLVCFTGVSYVSIVSVMPFLLLGIGVDDMFLLMSAWSETLVHQDLTIPERIGSVFKTAGIGITITSMTDFFAFMMGYTSVFVGVQNFCVYAGVGVLICYLMNATVFGACLTFHGRRVFSRRHTFTCLPVKKSTAEMLDEGVSCFRAYCCGGKIPKSAHEEQSSCERGPHGILTRVLFYTPVRILIVIVFLVYLGIAIWGCTKLEQGLNAKDLVRDDSYLLKFHHKDEDSFGIRIPISFVTIGEKKYSTPEALKNMKDLLADAKKSQYIDNVIDHCWLTKLATTPFYNTASEEHFISDLHKFLEIYETFYNDVVFSANNKSISASRCHISSLKLIDSNAQSGVMKEMRELADTSPADVFAFSQAFVIIEQFVTVLSSTLKTVGQTLAVMLAVTIVFLPHPMVVTLVMIQVIMILIGVFGFMSHAGLNLSAVTMIHLIMSVGFSVDFCAHVCTAYMVSEATNRQDRARYAVVHASGPILNGGFSSMLGVMVLYFTESFIFKSFFTIMMLVIIFGVAHAIFLIPVLLSEIGPHSHLEDLEDDPPQPSIFSRTNSTIVTARGSNVAANRRNTDTGSQNSVRVKVKTSSVTPERVKEEEKEPGALF